MKLYHLSCYKLKRISPACFGKNSYSQAEKAVSAFPRAFYYVNQYKKHERYFNNAYVHEVNMPESLLYDLETDIGNYRVSCQTFTALFNAVKWAGYKGVVYGEDKHKGACLFYSAKPDKVFKI